MSKVYLSIGGNLGNRESNLKASQIAIALKAGEIKEFSHIYETEAWGFDDDTKFYNQVIMIETGLDPDLLLQNIKAIEKLLGKKNERSNPEQAYSSRNVDIDIIFYDNRLIENKDLKIPHPHICERMFVLKPLNDIAPELVHPKMNKKISELMEECPDTSKIVKTELPGNLILYGQE